MKRKTSAKKPASLDWQAKSRPQAQASVTTETSARLEDTSVDKKVNAKSIFEAGVKLSFPAVAGRARLGLP